MFLIPTSTKLNNKKFVWCDVKFVHFSLPSATRTLYKFQGEMPFGSKENKCEKANGRIYLLGHTGSPVFPYEISRTCKNNDLSPFSSHLGSSSLMWWLIWIRSLVCGSFSDSVISSISGGTIVMIWEGSGIKRPSHNLSFSVSVFTGSYWGYPLITSVRTHYSSVETRIGDLCNRRETHISSCLPQWWGLD